MFVCQPFFCLFQQRGACIPTSTWTQYLELQLPFTLEVTMCGHMLFRVLIFRVAKISVCMPMLILLLFLFQSFEFRPFKKKKNEDIHLTVFRVRPIGNGVQIDPQAGDRQYR